MTVKNAALDAARVRSANRRRLPSQQEATVKRNGNLRPTPSTAQPEIRELQPPAVVTVLDANPVEGCYHVRTFRGKAGFVWGRISH